MTSEDLLSNLPILIMQPDEETFAMLEKNTRIIYSPDVMFTFKRGTTDAQIEEAVQEFRKTGIVDSMSNIIERSREMIIDNVRAVISRPLFLMIASVIAYLNVILVMVFKKQKDMSVSYLCGARKRDIVSTVFWACFIVTVIPSLIATVFILVAPEMQWTGRFQSKGLLITTDHLWVVAGYFAFTVIASVVAILISLGRKSPLEYLRGLE